MHQDKANNIVFFDGHCNLCNSTVNLLIMFDRKERLFFAPLSGQTARDLNLTQDQVLENQSIIFYRSRYEVFSKSDAVIEILREILPLGDALLIIKLIPKFIRDFAYQKVAKYRYHLFGKKEVCRIPSESEQRRFLN